MRTYATVLAALLALTAITVTVAGVHFGSHALNVIVALAIASVKASLVALFFMHLACDRPLNALIFVGTLAFLAIFLIFILLDVNYRTPAQALWLWAVSSGAGGQQEVQA